MIFSYFLYYCQNSNVFRPYIEGLFKYGFKKEIPNINYYKETQRIELEENNKLLLLFSGGKDSTAAAMKYKEEGYDVVLYFLQGINLSYLEELERAKVVANKLELPLVVDYINVTGKGEFLENPTKNQLILTFAINYGMKHNISKYAYGGFTEDVLEQSAFDRNFSDSLELFIWYVTGIREIFPELKVLTPFSNEVETLKMIGNHKELWNDFQSCLTPYRYRNHLKKTNEEKYNINLLDNRCGSCWKCCMEYIVWCDLEIVEYNKSFYEHCLEIFRNKLKEERPYAQPTKDLKEIYMIYIESEELLNKSKYFKEIEN